MLRYIFVHCRLPDIQLSNLAGHFEDLLKTNPRAIIDEITKFRVEKTIFQRWSETFKQAYKSHLKALPKSTEIGTILHH